MTQIKTQNQTNAENRQVHTDEIEAELNQRINNINSKIAESEEINEDDKKLIADLLDDWKKSHLNDKTFGYLN
jgi:hypothetical protein